MYDSAITSRSSSGSRKEFFLKSFYRVFFKIFFQLFIRRGKSFSIDKIQDSNRRRIWFHAASVGELETLIPLIKKWVERDFDLVLTTFSKSALKNIKDLSSELQKVRSSRRGKILYAGLSPIEGEWSAAIQNVNPLALITVKYEAWPDLWLSLKQSKVPLYILSAKLRSSLKICRWVLEKVFKEDLPQISFGVVSPSDVKALEGQFPLSKINVLGEARWDRVYERVQQGNPRATELFQKFSYCPRPWVVFGSLWPSDLEVFQNALDTFRGTLWWVPHQVKPEILLELEKFLKNRSLKYRFSLSDSALNPSGLEIIIVNELGFLLELYARADWAYVGGGFGKGIHSTIEPACHGVPIACGPSHLQVFPEVLMLQEQGQLSIVRDSHEFQTWWEGQVRDYSTERSQEQRGSWLQKVSSFRGATQRALEWIEKDLSRSNHTC